MSAVPALTIHARPDTSRALWEADDDVVIAELFDGLELAGAQVHESHVHRWRYAKTVTSLPEPCLRLRSTAPAVVAGDGFGAGGSIESAALSGLAAATAIADLVGIG